MSGALGSDFWERHYRDHPAAREPRPSPQLVAEARDLAPGRALDAGCGEGANAVWLARQGWLVTAVDLSETALRRAREWAAQSGGGAADGVADGAVEGVADRIEWMAADLTAEPPAVGAYDLVTAHYVHPAGSFGEFLGNLAAAVAPGGTLLVVGHDPADAHSSAHAPADVSFVASDAADHLDPDLWTVEVAETRTRRDAAHGVTMRDSVLRARRRGSSSPSGAGAGG